VSRPSRWSRLVLRAYPRAFRRAYGDEITRSISDLRTHGHRSRASVLWLVAADTLRTAPRLRMESLMGNHRLVTFTAVLTVAVLAALVGSPLLLLVVAAVVALMAILIRRGDRPIVADATSAAHWYRWLAAGAGCAAIGGVVLVVDGPELSSVGWTIWMLSWTAALVLVLFGLVLASTRLFHRGA
jgi:hypothetical protein